jgi:protein-S-isoprenylcysteine O-methyltransferase Ste14
VRPGAGPTGLDGSILGSVQSHPRLVRHPIYLGYFVTHVGFLLANGSPRNFALYIVVYFFQISRILAEERILIEDDSYRAYCQRVRYRLIPFIF